MRKIIKVSAISGVLWGLLALMLGYSAMGRIIWGGIIVSPIIGILAGVLAAKLHVNRIGPRLAISVVGLYGSALLFGLSCGIYDSLTYHFGARNNVEVVLQSGMGVIYGTTMFAWALLPLSFANFSIIGQILSGNGE